MKEELTELYSVTLKLPLWPLCDVTVTRRKMQLISRERSFLCSITVLHKWLQLFAYKVQITQELKPDDKPKRLHFTTDMLHRINMDPGFLLSILFSDEATFHQLRKVNRHNAYVAQKILTSTEVVRDSPKVNVWCGLMKDSIVGPFFFMEATVTGSVYLDMLEQFVYPQVADLQPNIICQQDGAPPHWSLHVQETLMRTFPDH
jgi:hypothetical protein